MGLWAGLRSSDATILIRPCSTVGLRSASNKLAPHPDPVFAYDGMERGVPRNTDRDAQGEEYSAKKKGTDSKT